jgi:hypothetical protein
MIEAFSLTPLKSGHSSLNKQGGFFVFSVEQLGG